MKTYDPEAPPRAAPTAAPTAAPIPTPAIAPSPSRSPAAPAAMPLPAPKPPADRLRPSALARLLASRPARAPADALRRKLLLGLPGGLALASPLGFVACGGSDQPGLSDNGAPDDGGPPGPLGSASTTITVQLPAALAASAGALQVVSATGTAPVHDGSATVMLLGDGPQLVSVIGADGLTRLLGWGGADQPPVSLQSTAAVLLHFGLGLPFLGAGARDELRRRLQTLPAVAVFGERIGAELQADAKALTAMNAGIAAGFEQAADAVLPAGIAAAAARRRPLGLAVEPAVDQSGLQVVQGDALNSVFVDNAYVRRAVVVVNREAWVDDAGTEHLEPDAPVQVGEAAALPLPTSVDSVANVVGGWANEYYAPDDPNSFFRSVSDTVTLDIAPADARRTRYNVVVLTAGALVPADAAEFARLPASQKAYVTGLDLDRNLILQMLLQDLLAPLFFEFLSSRIGAAGKNATEAQKADAEVLRAFAGLMLTTLQTRLPDVAQKLSAGSLDAWGAFKLILKACTVDPDTGEVSPVLGEFLSQGAQLCADALADVGLRSRMLEIATGFQLGNKNVLGFIPALNILSKFDMVLGKAALLRIVADSLRSSRMVCWSVVATRANVRLTPNPLKVDKTAVPYPIKAEIVDNDNDDYGNEKGSWRFDWVCTARHGDLFKPLLAGADEREMNRFSTSNLNASCDYVARVLPDADAAAETITVQAWFEPVGSSQPAVLVGQASCTLQFKQEFSLSLSPLSGSLPADIDMPLQAFFDQKLPAGATVDWTWTHGGAGRLVGPLANADPSASEVTLQTGSDDGTATVTVKAKVNIPSINGALPRSASTATVNASYPIKKGLKTVTFECGGGVFACGPTCGVTDYTAFIVPKIPGAIGYSGTFSEFGYGPCNRSVSWNSILGDGGGCSFPITGHPFSAGIDAPAWAVWIGFGGPLTGPGKFVATITLPA